jgi:hypothetical protein
MPMSRPIFAPQHPREVQLSTTVLTTAAESGAVGRDLGLLPARQHQLPAGWPPAWLRFCDSSQPRQPRQHTPMPIPRRQHHPLPAA